MRVAFAHPGNYDCRLGIYVGSVMPPDGANTEFGIVQRLIKLGSLTGCDACQKKACFLLAANREGGRVLPGGASLPCRSIGLLNKKICRNFGNFGITDIGRQRRLQLWTSSKGHRPRSTAVISKRRIAGELSWPRRFHRLVRFVRLVMMNGRSFRISIWRRKILNASPGFIPKRARTFSARRKRAVINLITKGVSGIMKISAEVFGAYLNCPTKCWLRAAGHPPTGNAYSEWVKAQNDSYRGPHAKVGHDEVLPGRRLQLLVRPPNRADHFITSGAELDRQARQRNTVEHRAPG
jgi:hypothetical protein